VVNYCEKHEISNCAICNGDAARLDALLADPGPPPTREDALPIRPGAKVIWARFGGSCAGCGRRYERDTVIFSPFGDAGWYGYDCCG